jgi:hypothetical protein
MHLRSAEFLMVNANINFKLNNNKKSLHCPFTLMYYRHKAHENVSTPATSSELDIKGCTIIRQKQ